MNAFWLIYNLDKRAKDQGLQDNSEHEMETTCPVLKPDDKISAGEHMSEDAVKGWLQQYAMAFISLCIKRRHVKCA